MINSVSYYCLKLKSINPDYCLGMLRDKGRFLRYSRTTKTTVIIAVRVIWLPKVLHAFNWSSAPKALEIIDFVDLIEKRHHFAKELSTGQRKRLEMARAMAIAVEETLANKAKREQQQNEDDDEETTVKIRYFKNKNDWYFFSFLLISF